jgi:predicted DNA-binding protein with PD1-like motif
MVEGIRDCALSQGSITWSRKSPLTHSHGKTSDDFDSVVSGHVFKEKVVSESDGFAVP